MHFHWVGVQFTAEASTVYGTVNACRPLVAARDMKSLRSRRRLSIAPKDVQDMINAIALANQKAQDEANRKEQARLAQQNRHVPRPSRSSVSESKSGRTSILRPPESTTSNARSTDYSHCASY
jgi:hypothetical protein